MKAKDSGKPALSSTVTVYFNVLDLNDNAPLFDPMSYSDEVYENVTIGTSILTVSATDQDSGNLTFFDWFIFNDPSTPLGHLNGRGCFAIAF